MSLSGMPDWQDTFKRVFDAGVAAYNTGTREADKMFSNKDQVFLGTIGATAREIFDFVEDYCRYGEPDFESVLAVTAIRRRYFTEVQHGIPSQFEIDPNELPSRYVPSVEKARKELGLKPRMGLAEAIRHTLDYYEVEG